MDSYPWCAVLEHALQRDRVKRKKNQFSAAHGHRHEIWGWLTCQWMDSSTFNWLLTFTLIVSLAQIRVCGFFEVMVSSLTLRPTSGQSCEATHPSFAWRKNEKRSGSTRIEWRFVLVKGLPQWVDRETDCWSRAYSFRRERRSGDNFHRLVTIKEQRETLAHTSEIRLEHQLDYWKISSHILAHNSEWSGGIEAANLTRNV